MAHQPRLNRIIDRLVTGQPAVGTFVTNGSLDDLAYVTDEGYDFVAIENEHVGMNFTTLSISLQFLLSRQKLSTQGSLQANPTPVVRVAPNAAELGLNQWVLKQTLDHGVYGMILPRMESVEAAKAAVTACRYVQRPGVPDAEPKGKRGWSPGTAARYWGLSTAEYYDACDLWPLDPDGEMLLIAICETTEGIENLPAILREVKGIGVVWGGPGDLSVSMGTGGNSEAPEVQEGLLKILKISQRHGVPCAVSAASPKELDRRLEQGFQVIFASPERSTPVLDHARAKFTL